MMTSIDDPSPSESTRAVAEPTAGGEHRDVEHRHIEHRHDAAHDAATSGGTPHEQATASGSPEAGTVDDEASTDAVDGVLSPGSTATGSPTDAA